MKTRHLNSIQLKGLQKLGDALIPGDGDLPKFSRTGCEGTVDGLIDCMPTSDVSDLKMLLTLMGLLPLVLVSWIIALLEKSPSWGDWAALPRLVRMSVRGLIMTLYYSHPPILDSIGYRVRVYTEDLT